MTDGTGTGLVLVEAIYHDLVVALATPVEHRDSITDADLDGLVLFSFRAAMAFRRRSVRSMDFLEPNLDSPPFVDRQGALSKDMVMARVGSLIRAAQLPDGDALVAAIENAFRSS